MNCERCGADHLEPGVKASEIPEEWCRGALFQEIQRLKGIADRANKAMEKHMKHNGALEIAIQEAHRDTDSAVKDGNRLADALVKSREEVANVKLQNDELGKQLSVQLGQIQTLEGWLADMKKALADADATKTEKRNHVTGYQPPAGGNLSQ